MTLPDSTRENFDVVVVGGGAGGVAAALGAARLGARTALIERYGFLGGAATNAQVLSYCGFHIRGEPAREAVGGVGREVIRGLRTYGISGAPVIAPSGNWIIMLNPEAVKAILDDLLLQAGVAVRLHALVVDAVRRGNRIEAVVAADHAGRRELAASCFVDASGEGDLSHQAGARMAWSKADGYGRHSASFCGRIGGIPRGVTFDRERLAELIAGDNAPKGNLVLRASGGVLMRLPDNDDVWWMGIDVVTDGLSSVDLSAAERESRALAWRFVRLLRRHPGCENATLNATGPQIGIRETRHPVARLMISEQDAAIGKRSDTSIARAAWSLENHDTLGKPVHIPVGGEGFFDVPAAALQAADLDNLWLGGRLIGCDRTAYGSVRVMGTSFATGQAAGVSAALAAGGTTDYAAIARALRDQDAIF